MKTLQIVTSSPPQRTDAPDLVLIHGWGIGRAAWDAPLPLLAGRFRVHRASLPGYDGSPDAPDLVAGPGGEERDDAMRTFDACAAALAQALPVGCAAGAAGRSVRCSRCAPQLAPQRFSRLIVCGASPCFTQRTDWPHAQAPGA